MSIQEIQVVILNHNPQAVKRFGRNSSALSHYQEGDQSHLIDSLHHKWFSVTEACIVAHHVATFIDEGEVVNHVVAVNSQYASTQLELQKPKGKVLRYIFIFFETTEEKARQYVYRSLRQTVIQYHPVNVEVSFHNVSFY